MTFDTIIKGGTVVDGSGLPMRRADVAIRDGLVTDIGRLSGARRTVDADGLVVMPGIVDVHTHYDPQLSFEPFATSSCYHGVTSVVAGNCGYSIAPCRAEDREWVTALFAKVEGMTPSVLRSGLPWDWDSFPSFLDVLDRRLGINAAVYVGHSALRRFVMGDAASERAATADEVEHMRRLVRAAMAAGAAGFSSSQAPTHTDQLGRPVPSRHAAFDEVLALAEAAGEGGAGSIAFLAETAVQGYDARDREDLRDGLDHPNTDPKQGSTLPMPALDRVFVDRSRAHPDDVGKSLAALATERRVHAADVMCELSLADGLETQFLWNSESPAWVDANAESQRNLHMIVGTGDGGAHADRDDGSEWSTYYLRSWVLDRKLVSLEDGVRRITHLPAMVTGLKARGLLARGYHADILVFDPARLALGRKELVRDMPGGEERWQVRPEGVVSVIVNGDPILEDGKLTGARPGRVLRVGNPA